MATGPTLPQIKPGAHILIVEDDSDSALYFGSLMKSEGYQIDTIDSAELALEKLQAQTDYDLVLLDLILPGMSGWELLEHIKMDGKLRYIPVVVLSALHEKPDVLRALELGAEDYLTKPVDVETMLSRVRVMLRIRTLYEELISERFDRQLAERTLEMRRYLAKVMGGSALVQEMADILDNVVATDTTVLLEGESGTGKSMLAEVIHRFSKRADGPFIVVNCSAYPETLLGSELFGHEKGSFTGAIRRKRGRFEQASGGTIFLDEVADISPLTQLSLLRVIQDRQFERVGGEVTLTTNVRIVAATNKMLSEQVDRGLFRQDLYYRLNVVRLEVPSLRQRPEDIPFLCNFFLQRHREKLDKAIYGFSRGALDRLIRYGWPGNVRELRNVMEHAVLMCQGEVIQVGNLPADFFKEEQSAGLSPGRLKDQERELVSQTLEQVSWNKYRAAQILGISRSTLYSKIRKFGIKEITEELA